jgi:hypothetical protein
MGGRVVLLLLAALLLHRPASAQEPSPVSRRGPMPARDEWLLAQPMLTLPAVAPDALGAGRLELRLDGDWGSDFALVEGRPGGVPTLRYLVDGEHRSAALTVRRGMGTRFTLGLRVPVLWRGAGVLDGLIDTWHRWFRLPDAGRSLVPDGEFRIEGRDTLGRPLAWRGRPGTGLGNLELEGHGVLAGAADPAGWRLAAVARLSLPTATGTYAHAGTAAGAQLVAAWPLGRRADLYLGLGALTGTCSELAGISYDRTRGEGFLALEGRLTRGWSLIAQLDAATRLVTGIPAYPGTTVYLRVGSKFGLHPGWMLEAGITEGIKNQVASTDFGVLFALGRRF